MGSLLSTLQSNQSSSSKLKQTIDYCSQEVPELSNLVKSVQSSASTSNLDDIRQLYLKSLEYIKCSNANSQLLKSQIYQLYQDVIIERAIEVLKSGTDWVLPEASTSKKQEENDMIQLTALQERMKDLNTKVADISDITKYYTREDTQAVEIVDAIKLLQTDANEKMSVASEAVDVYKARYLFGIILCNYTTGSNRVSEDRLVDDIKSYLTLETYKGCMMFSEFIPLLWPTDEDFWATKNLTSFTVTDEFITNYLETGETIECIINLSKYYSSYFWPKYDAGEGSVYPNCNHNPRYTDSFTSIQQLVAQVVDNVDIRTWGEFFTEGRKVLDQIETHHIKMLPFMARKKNLARAGELMKIPETWPKYNRDVELYEAIVSVMNVCFANCGGEKDSDYTSELVEYQFGSKFDEIKKSSSKPITHIKNIGGITYKDLGLHSLNKKYFDSRAFIVVEGDAAFDEIPADSRTSHFVKASELDIKAWDGFMIDIDADPDDVKRVSVDDGKSRMYMYNNTGYFSDKVFNCVDMYQFVEAYRFPIIPGLTAYRKKTQTNHASESDTSQSTSSQSTPSIITIHQPKSSEYEVNPMVQQFFNEVITNATTNMHYNSLNNRLYSSIDYMTASVDGDINFSPIAHYIYYNLVPRSLSFELLIPLNTQCQTHMCMCTNDIKNGCAVEDLIPFVFEYPMNGEVISDPLFEVDDINACIKASTQQLEESSTVAISESTDVGTSAKQVVDSFLHRLFV